MHTGLVEQATGLMPQTTGQHLRTVLQVQEIYQMQVPMYFLMLHQVLLLLL